MKGNARSSGYERQVNDWYVEPRRAIDALLDVEAFEGMIWDPACGGGNIPKACAARGLNAFGTDLVDRGYGVVPQNFLDETNCSTEVNSIVTNPPFHLAVEFALRGLLVASDRVCILQRLTWLEGTKRHARLFSKSHLMRVWQFRSRISMPPGDSDAPASGGSVAFAWFVFSREHNGPYAGGRVAAMTANADLNYLCETRGLKCHWCGRGTRRAVSYETALRAKNTTMDHLLPKCRGGRSTRRDGYYNLKIAFLGCNMKRAAAGHCMAALRCAEAVLGANSSPGQLVRWFADRPSKRSARKHRYARRAP